jgi:hypothetical protein
MEAGRYLRVFDRRAEDGQLRGFEVENLLLTRRSVGRVVASIPGVQVIRPGMMVFLLARILSPDLGTVLGWLAAPPIRTLN